MGSRRQTREAAPVRHERMSAVDTAWLRMDGPGNAMTIVSVITTDAPVEIEALRQAVATRLLCFPRFRRRPVTDAIGASWHEVAEVDLEAHVVATKLPRPGGQAQLQRLAARLAGERLDPARPLWQIHLVERYRGGSAWVLRVHHCYADGMAMLRVLLSLTGQDPVPALAPARESLPGHAAGRGKGRVPPVATTGWLGQVSAPAGDIAEQWLAEAAHLLERGVHRLFHPDAGRSLAAQGGAMLAEFTRVLALPDEPPTALRGALSGIKRAAWSEPLELEAVRGVARALGCTVNDVLLSTVAGALGAHLREARTADLARLVLRASVPVNLRTAEEPLALGNRFGLAFVDLPVGVADPVARTRRLHETMRAVKDSVQPATTLVALAMMGLAPAPLQAAAVEAFSRKATLVASNVPGPQAPLYLCGQRIREMYFWVPQSGSIGLGVSLLSYAGQVFLGCLSDRRILADPASLVARLGPEFERLRLAATRRRVPAGPPRGPRARRRPPVPPRLRRQTTPVVENA